MKAAHKFSTLPAVALETNRSLKNMFFLSISLFLTISALWYGKSVVSAPLPTPFQASTLDLTLSGAMNMTLSLTDWDTVDATFSPEGFILTFNDAPLAFDLEFKGLANTEATVYDLSAGTYPLSLTLLDGQESYHSFTATGGTVELAGDKATITAFLSDELGQQLFFNARFNLPNTTSLQRVVQTLSERSLGLAKENRFKYLLHQTSFS